MNAYFFNITSEERSNILDQHKTVYDGYVTNYVQPGVQDLYVQDFANDKGGITINNRGEVSEYKHMKINEDVSTGSAVEPYETFEDIYVDELGGIMNDGIEDEIGDGPMDLEHGTFGDDSDESDIVLAFDDIDEDMVEPLQEQLNKTLEMFQRFKKY